MIPKNNNLRSAEQNDIPRNSNKKVARIFNPIYCSDEWNGIPGKSNKKWPISLVVSPPY
jgi:hypothetical protein